MIHVFLKGVELRWQQYSFLFFMNEGIIGAPIHNIDYRFTFTQLLGLQFYRQANKNKHVDLQMYLIIYRLMDDFYEQNEVK